jgi:hypothetical protein|tara:strand:+ start:38 stop:376 length:339 start_codon:yes stop_codon:yes gene_type:complete
MERYLYFTNPNDAGAPNANAELAMYPTSSVTAIFAASATTTTINLVPRDGTGTTEDVVTLTHVDGDHKNVIGALVAMINAEKNNSPFVVIADKEKGVFNINGVTACAITSAD